MVCSFLFFGEHTLLKSLSLRFSLVTILIIASFDLFSKTRTDADELSALLSASADIQGSFIQFVVDGRGTRVQETRGEFKAKKPDLFYWETKAPLAQKIYVYQGEVTVYDPDLEQASVQLLGDDLSATPAMLFNGDAALIANNFIVEKRDGEGDEAQFLLFPSSEGSLFEVLRVRFKGTTLSDLRITDSLGQDTTVSFISTFVNSGLTEKDFKPDLPEGTDVIRQGE